MGPTWSSPQDPPWRYFSQRLMVPHRMPCPMAAWCRPATGRRRWRKPKSWWRKPTAKASGLLRQVSQTAVQLKRTSPYLSMFIYITFIDDIQECLIYAQIWSITHPLYFISPRCPEPRHLDPPGLGRTLVLRRPAAGGRAAAAPGGRHAAPGGDERLRPWNLGDLAMECHAGSMEHGDWKNGDVPFQLGWDWAGFRSQEVICHFWYWPTTGGLETSLFFVLLSLASTFVHASGTKFKLGHIILEKWRWWWLVNLWWF